MDASGLSSLVVVLLCVGLLAAPVTTAGAVDAERTGAGTPTGPARVDSADATRPQVADGLVSTQVDPDDVLLRVDLRADGDAAWVVEYRVRLDDQNATEAFRTVRRDIRENPSTFTGPFADRMGATARDAENATGRVMSIRNVTVSTTTQQLPQEFGVVTYRFEWTNFAATEGDRLVAGDAVAGLFLDRRSTLLLSWPASYGLQDAAPTPDETRDDAVLWLGPVDFTGEEPRVTVAPAATTTAGGGEGGTGGTGGDTTGGGGTGDASSPETAATDGEGDGLPWVPILVVVVLVGAGAVAATRTGLLDDLRGGEGPSRDASRGDGPPPDDPTAGPDAAGTATAGAGDDVADGSPPEDLLSNEERVLKLVRERGGRVKQQEVAEGLDWTDAKTSQVVRQMREEGQLDGFRLGRENVITLPDHDPVGDDDPGDSKG